MIADGRDQLVARAGDAETVTELFAGASARLRRLVPFDAAVWLATDPATGLPTPHAGGEPRTTSASPTACAAGSSSSWSRT